MSIQLPPPIARYVQLENASDTETLSTCFAPNAIVRDESRIYEGLAAITAWKAETKQKYHHILCWLIVMQAFFPGCKTLEELARWTPASSTVWRFRRLLLGFVFAMARTWKTAEGQAIKNLVTHLPRTYDQRTRLPRLPSSTGYKTVWVYSTCVCLRHIGDVTVVLSKRGRNVGPKHTKILVTNLDEWTPRQVVCAYQRRWPVEQINRELKTT